MFTREELAIAGLVDNGQVEDLAPHLSGQLGIQAYQMLNVTDYTLVRIGFLGQGSCAIHAVFESLNASHPIPDYPVMRYRDAATDSHRVRMISDHRTSLFRTGSHKTGSLNDLVDLVVV